MIGIKIFCDLDTVSYSVKFIFSVELKNKHIKELRNQTKNYVRGSLSLCTKSELLPIYVLLARTTYIFIAYACVYTSCSRVRAWIFTKNFVVINYYHMSLIFIKIQLFAAEIFAKLY